MDRRKLLTGAVLGSAIVGASALGGFAAEDAFAAEVLKIDPGAPDPEFAEGLIKSIDGSTLRATGTDTTLWSIRVTDSTSVWKLKPSDFDSIEVGDGLYARGALMDDGTLAADSVWVNIVNIKAHVVSVKDKELRLDHNGERIVAHVVDGTSAAVYNGSSAVSDLSGIKTDSHVQVLGAWRPGTNEVDIATVYAAR
ncbi:MAG: cell wall protein [Stackebrandtia sp.]